MDRGTISLSDRLYLTGDSNGIDNKHSGWRCAGLSRLDHPNQSLTHPGTVVSTIQSLASTLKRAALVFNPWCPLFYELAGSDDVCAIAFAQQIGNSGLTGANRPGQNNDAEGVFRSDQANSSTVARLG